MPVLQGPLRGSRWIAGASDHGCWLGSYELAKQRALARELRPGSVFYDLGANVGWYSLLGSALGASEVYSFEPVPSNVSILREHLRLNKIRNCVVIEAAAGEADGWSEFEPGASNSMGHLTSAASPRALRVRVRALDSMVESGEVKPPGAIKCDIEGGELNALIGARRVLEKHAPSLLLATHTAALFRDCRDFLVSLGYVTEPLPGTPEEDEMVARRKP